MAALRCAPPVFLVFSRGLGDFFSFSVRWSAGGFPNGRWLDKVAVFRAPKFSSFRIWREKLNSDEVAAKTWLLTVFRRLGFFGGV